ncbi:MAG: hypothetical protein HYU83_02500 [Chloroflexi bacterium]|nr:hypothetical protein [Chloroflexota bacterium]
MNWFERYGIPGLYFVALMAGWIYAFFPQAVPFIHLKHFDWMTGLIAALVAISLPIGYIISIISQAVYLDWRRCFQMKLMPFFLHQEKAISTPTDI